MNRKTVVAGIAILVAVLIIAYRPSTITETPSNLSDSSVATFAGGCFWCMEAAFEATDGVIESISGYTGGHVPNPTYEQVNTKTTGHLEAVQVYYNPSKISYEELLDVFWRNIDPTDGGGQFADRGEQYQTAIFYSTPEEKALAEESKQALDRSSRFDKPIVTEVLELDVFYKAEEYHQNYYKKSVANYKVYSSLSGREEFKEENWGE